MTKLRLRCRRSERTGPCSGRLRLATRDGARLGSKRFKVGPGRSKRVRVGLGSRERALTTAPRRVAASRLASLGQ